MIINGNDDNDNDKNDDDNDCDDDNNDCDDDDDNDDGNMVRKMVMIRIIMTSLNTVLNEIYCIFLGSNIIFGMQK